MYKDKLRLYSPRKSQLKSVDLIEGETIEQKIERLVQNKEPIKDGAPEIFTERKQGVLAAYNIRSDRWEIAAEAMDKIQASIIAKREEKSKTITEETNKKENKKEDKKENIEDKSTQGKTE